MEEFTWPEITKDTPLEEIKRIHQQIWDYVITYGKKPKTPYRFNCVACEYVKKINRYNFLYKGCFYLCPISWERRSMDPVEYCSKEYYDWNNIRTKENAKRIRDTPFKFEWRKHNGRS